MTRKSLALDVILDLQQKVNLQDRAIGLGLESFRCHLAQIESLTEERNALLAEVERRRNDEGEWWTLVHALASDRYLTRLVARERTKATNQFVRRQGEALTQAKKDACVRIRELQRQVDRLQAATKRKAKR